MREKNTYPYTFPFEKLDVWKNAIKCRRMDYGLTKAFATGKSKLRLTYKFCNFGRII